MSKYTQRGAVFCVASDAANQVTDALPAGTYTVGISMEIGFYLEMIEPMTMPSKVYGHAISLADRIMTTFESRSGNTGVLMTGEKGSGKTMQLRILAHYAQKLGMPVIVINSKFHGEQFNKFIQNISQPVMIAFDEFEKVYGDATHGYGHQSEGSSEQDAILTLLDGTYTGKKLFVFTGNNASRISKHMMNRPGRVFYHLQYRGLDEDVLEGYAADHLKNKDHLKSLQGVAGAVDSFSFDMMQALIEEMNRFGEDAATAAKLMNIRPENSAYINYTVTVTKDGKDYKAYGHGCALNPLATPTYITVGTGVKNREGDEDTVALQVNASLLSKKDGDTLLFKNDGYDITYARQRAREYSFSDY